MRLGQYVSSLTHLQPFDEHFELIFELLVLFRLYPGEYALLRELRRKTHKILAILGLSIRFRLPVFIWFLPILLLFLLFLLLRIL